MDREELLEQMLPAAAVLLGWLVIMGALFAFVHSDSTAAAAATTNACQEYRCTYASDDVSDTYTVTLHDDDNPPAASR